MEIMRKKIVNQKDRWKKILLVFAVIISGFVLGIYLSDNPPSIKLAAIFPEGKIQQADKKPANSSKISAKLTAQPISVQHSGDLDPATELAKIDKSNLDIQFENKTSSELTGVEIWIVTDSTNKTGVAMTSEETVFDKDKSHNNAMVFKVPDVPKGESQTTTIQYFIHEEGEAMVHAEIKTKQGRETRTNSVVIKST